MSGRSGAQVSGVSELSDALALAGEGLRDMTSAHAEAGALVTATARPRTPRRSGRLAASVRAYASENETVVGSDLEYAGLIHWGFQARNIRAQPWLLDAAESETTQVTDIFAADVAAIIDKVGT